MPLNDKFKKAFRLIQEYKYSGMTSEDDQNIIHEFYNLFKEPLKALVIGALLGFVGTLFFELVLGVMYIYIASK